MAEVNDANEAAQVVEVNVVVEHLQVLGLISAGDFSSVVAARRQTDNRIYCVKAFRRDMILAPDPNEPDTPLAFRVLRELRGNQTVSQLPHPFIAQCCFAYKNDDFLLIGMERAGATDLLSHLSDHGTIDEAATRFYAIEIHLALAHFHSFDLVHRDVKPENIIIRLDGHIKLIDFGTCLKLTGRMGDQPPPSRLCSVAGTPEYMPPEIVIGLPVCESVDWWSFGCLICEMLIDRTPFLWRWRNRTGYRSNRWQPEHRDHDRASANASDGIVTDPGAPRPRAHWPPRCAPTWRPSSVGA